MSDSAMHYWLVGYNMQVQTADTLL